MRVQKTRKRQRQREHVKQNLREHKQRNIEFYTQTEESVQDNIFKNSIALEHKHDERLPVNDVNKNKTLKEASHEDMLIFGSKKVGTFNHVRKNSATVNNKSVDLDILNDPKKLDEFKKFQEYLKLKEKTDKIMANKEVKVKEIVKEKEEEEENSYDFEYEEEDL